MDEEELSTKQDRLKEGGQGNQELTASDAKDQSAGETSVQLNLDELPEQQPEHGAASASTTATLEPANSNSFQQAHSPAEDSLDSAGVEIVTVMPDEELEPVQPLEATDELEETQERQPPPGVSLQQLTLNTAAEDDSPEIEEIECLPPSASDGGQLSATAPELPQEQSSSAATAQITESAIIEAMELDDPIVETVQFTAGSSSETVLEEEEPPPLAENHKETTATSAAELNELEYLEEEEEDSSDQPTNSQQSTITDAATILESDSSKDGTSASENVAPPAPEPEMPESSDLFKDVKFAVCEDLNDIDKIKRVLVNSGAKFLNYLSDSATHLIADNAEHLNVSEAIDIYEKPVVTSQWVWLSLRSHKVLPLAPFSPFRDRLFSSLVACPSRLSPADQQSIWSMITYYGGRYQTTLDGSCTHLITTAISGAKYEAVESSTKCKVVTPDWVLECVKKKSLIDVERYHPKLLSTYNAGQKVKGGTTTKSSATMAAEKSSASNKVDDEMAIFTRSTKAVTMAISTEAVLSRKVEPFKPELTLEQPAASVPTTVQQSVNAHSLLLRPAATAGSGQQISGSATNVQMQHQRPLVPNSTGMVAYPRHPHPQQQQHPQVHPHAHPHPQTQQSKAVQLVNHHNAYALQQQQHNCPNRHLAPMVAQGQQGNVQHQQTMLVQQHQHMAQQHHQQQQPMTPAQAKKAKQGQVHAVKSKGPAKGAAKGASGKKSQQQQAQQHLMQHGHLGAEHGGGQMEQSMLQHPQGPPSGGHPVSQTNYHPGASLMQQQQHSQMVNNQMHSPTYRPPHSPAMVQQQQQMGGMVQQVPQQQQPQQVQLQQASHRQGQPQSRQVYLTLQQQQQMQFVNGQGQFVRGQFITRAPQPQQQQQSLLQQQQHPQHPPIGSNVPNQGMPPGSPAPGQQMYRHPSPQQQQQFQQMQQQQVQRPMYAQMTPQGQVYVSQHPQTMQRMPMQGQQVQLQQQTSQTGQPVSVQQQQAMMNQNQYNHQQQQQQMTAAVHPQEVGGQTAAASISPGSGLQQYQQQHPGPQRMPVNMIRMSSLTPEQQQQILQQQQKMQQQAQAQQQQQSAAGYATAMQQQQAQSGQQAMQIRSVTPSSGQPSPQTPPQLLSPSGTPVPQQRMMVRPTMHPQVQQQQVYGQMVDPTKVPQSQQQIAVRPQVQMQQQGPPGQQVPQQFTPQQVQFIRQRWATPVSEQQQQQQQYPGGKPPQHQFVHMTATGPRQMVVTQGQGPPQHLTPQQQQMWLQQQQARQRFVLQQQQQQQQSPRMMRMPMNNGPMPVQQMQPQQATAQQQQHPVGGMASLGGHDPTKMTQQQPQATTQPTPSPAVMSSAPSHDQLASHGQAPAAAAGVHHGHVLPSVQQHNATLGPNGPQPSSFGIHHQPPASPFASGPQTPAQHQPLPPAGQVPPMNGPIANLAHGPMGPRSAGALLPAGHAHAHPVHPSMHPLHGHHPQVGPAGVQPTTNGTTPAPVPAASPHPQVVQIRFYGQDARQPIPPEFCLIGCVFYISPTYTENVLTAKLVPGWKRRIEQYGGRVVDSYVSGPANTVTHFVTEHMIGGLQKLALSEGKRCVSIFWLDDVLGNRRLLPPWRFYHLPLAYSHNKPCRNHIIAISNFEGEERQIMRQLIARTGAIFTDYLTSKNTILICKKLEGPKYEKALQWRIAIVNLYWLQDVLFGLPETLQLSSLSKKYQQFEQYANASIITSNSNLTPSQMLQRDIFRVEYNSVTGLMSPWRYPIKFDQEDLAVRMKKADEERQREEAKRREEEERRAEQLRVETRREEEEKERLEEDMETTETAPERMDQEGGLISQSDATPGSNTEKQVRQLTLESAPPQAATKRSFDELASVEGEEQNQIQANAVSESTSTQVDAEPATEERPLKRIKLEEDCQDSVTTVVEQNLELQAEQPMEVEEEKPSTAALDAAELQKEASIDESASQGEPEIEVIEIPVGSSAAGNQEGDEKKKEAEEQVPSEPVPETSQAAVEAPEAKIEEKQPDEPTATPSEESVTIKEEDSDEAKTDDPEIEVVQMDQVSKAVPSPGQQSAEAAKPLISDPVPTVNGGDQPADTDTTTEEDSSITKEVAPSIPVMVAEITENSTHSTDESSTTATHFKVPLANAASTSSTTTVSPTPPPAVRLVAVLFTAIDAVSRDELRTIVDNLGGKVVGDPDQCTHLIADRIVPTVKYLCAFARAQYVLTSEWLRECARSGAFVEESTYQLADRHSASQYQVDLPRALSTRSAALFKDTVFLLTRSCIPSPSILQRIIQANGGAAVLYKSPSRRQLALLRERKITFVVVSCETDLHTCDQFFENQIKVVTAQAILNAIFRQQLDYDAYAFRSAKSTSPGTKTPTTPPPNGVRHHQMLLSSATPMATLNQ